MATHNRSVGEASTGIIVLRFHIDSFIALFKQYCIASKWSNLAFGNVATHSLASSLVHIPNCFNNINSRITTCWVISITIVVGRMWIITLKNLRQLQVLLHSYNIETSMFRAVFQDCKILQMKRFIRPIHERGWKQPWF